MYASSMALSVPAHHEHIQLTQRHETQRRIPLGARMSKNIENTISLNCTFLCQEIHTTNWFLHLKAFLHLTGFYVPEADGFIIRSRDEPLA